MDDVPALPWRRFDRHNQINRRDVGGGQLERRRTDSDEQLEIYGAAAVAVVEAAGGCMAMAGGMPRQVRMYSVLPVMMTGGIAEMRVHERRAHGRGMDRRRQPDGDQLSEHTALLVPIQGKSRRVGVHKPEEFLNSCSGLSGPLQPCARIALRMRTIQWLFVVGVLLFITGIGFVIAGAREARSAGPAAETAPAAAPVASVKQIMAAITGPAAAAVYNSVGTVVSVDGIKETAPQNDAEWAALGNQAAALVESGNLLLVPGRAIDNGDWVKMTQDFIEKSKVAMKAADSKSTDAVLSAGSDLNVTCDNCHARYLRQ